MTNRADLEVTGWISRVCLALVAVVVIGACASDPDVASFDAALADGNVVDGPVPHDDAAADAAEPPVADASPDAAVADAAVADAAVADAAVADAAAPDGGVLGEIHLFSGNQQSGVVAVPLASAFVVEVTDVLDEPAANVEVAFVVTSGGGSVSAASATTDANGRARTTLTPGPIAGTNHVEARLPGVSGSPVVFTATGLAGPAHRILAVSGNGQRRMVGQTVLAPFVVAVEDVHANPVAGATVSFAVTGGDGKVSVPEATADVQGRAQTVLTMGLALETNTVEARATGLVGSPVVFSVQADGFHQRVSFGVGSKPSALAAGDLNGDGKPDLVTANTITSTSILIDTTFPSSSEPTFVPMLDQTVGGFPSDVAMADLNGDGKLDLVFGDNLSGSTAIRLMLNTSAAGASTPSFAPVALVEVGAQPLARVTAGDLNADGRPDLVIATDTTKVAVLLNTTVAGAAAATFTPAKVFFASGGQIAQIAIGDLNGDARPDLAIASPFSDAVAVLLNQTGTGSSTASFAAAVPIASGKQPVSIALGDLDSDGRLDLAVAALDGNEVSVHINTAPTGSTVPSFAAKVGFPIGQLPQSVVIGDLDDDGMPDLAVASFAFAPGAISVLVNTAAPGASTPSFGKQVDYPMGLQPREVVMVDVNGDGRKDLAACNFDENTVSVLLAD